MKKLTSKVISLMLMITMIVMALPVVSAETTQEDKYVKVNYSYDCDGDELSFSHKPNSCKYGSSFTTTMFST